MASTPTITWAIRHAIVVNGGGVGSGNSKSICPSRCTVQQPSTGSQKYSSSVNPSRRWRSCPRQWKSSWSASWVVRSVVFVVIHHHRIHSGHILSQDWRSLRLDRMDDVRALGTTFTPRPAPDAASYVRRSISASPYRYVARVRYFAPQDFVAQYFPAGSATIESDGADACVVTAGADDPQRMALFFA